MTRLARLLPLLTLAAWVITLAVPLFQGDDPDNPALSDVVTVSSLGGAPFDLDAASWPFVLSWIAIAGLTVSAWFLRSLRVWSLVAIGAAVALSLQLYSVISYPPVLLWDGMDGQGNMIGGQITGVPTVGVPIWMAGIAALGLAGVLGLIGSFRGNAPLRPLAR